MSKVHILDGVKERIKLYAALGYPALKSAKGYEVSGGWTSPVNPTKKIIGTRSPEGRLTFHDTYEQAVDALREKLAGAEQGGEASKRAVKLDLYKVNATGDIVIGKKIAAGKFVDLKAGFKNVGEARKYLAEHEQELIDLLERKKDVRPERRGVNDPRVGQDYRNGEPVTAEKFAGEFSFRGIQFGNYVEQSKRQGDLNNAYDALLDLANIINVPPRAISLNGTLGLAFGARGSGGKNAAAAHYEPGEVVINLTKREGAGSLAHEWFHGLDNYFSRMRGENDKFATANPRAKMVRGTGNTLVQDDRVRPEVLEAFDGVMKAVRNSEFFKRSQQLDQTRSKDYWSTPHEMAARAFESYLIAKAAERGESNDYLANIVSEEAHQAGNERLGEEPYPYPTKAEQVAINAAFDRLFQTLQTKETEQGVALYSRRIHGERMTSHDYVVPETPEFDGNMSGDLAYTPQSAEAKGIEQFPIRLTVGVAKSSHRGYGINHIKAEGDAIKSRRPPEYTDDEAENYARHVATIAKSFGEIYEEDGKLILRSARMKEALVVSEQTDRETGEKFYSVVSLRPAEKVVWGAPVWFTGRASLPGDRLLQPRASEPSPDQNSQQSDRQVQRNQTSKFILPQVEADRQPKQAVM